MAHYYAVNGWEPYNPMPDSDADFTAGQLAEHEAYLMAIFAERS